MEAGDSTTGDGDEDVWQDRTGDDRAAAGAELGDSRHLDGRADDDDADGQGADGPDLHVRREVITRCQEQPYRKGSGYEAVDDEGDGNAFGADGKERSQGRRCLDGRAEDDGQQGQGDADDGAFFNAARAQELHINTDENSNRNGHADGERTPRAVVQGVDDDDGHAGHSQDVEEQDGEGRSQASLVTNLGFCDLSDGFAIVTHGAEEDDHVVDSTGEDAADEDPQGTGQITELSGNDRAYERAGTGDSGEVMAKDDVLVGRHVVVAVFKAEGRRDLVLIDRQDFGGNEGAIETVSQYKY